MTALACLSRVGHSLVFGHITTYLCENEGKKNREVILGAGVSELGDHGPLFLGSFSQLN